MILPRPSPFPYTTLFRSVPIGGCIATDNDFDGVPYQRVWPGTDPNRGQDAKYHPTPITFTSPLINGTQNYSRVAFRSEEHTSELQSLTNLVCRLLLEKKN